MRKVLYIFGLLTDADIDWMARVGIRRRLKDGEILIEQGKPIDSIILLLEGQLSVAVRDVGTSRGGASASSWVKCPWSIRHRRRPPWLPRASA